MFDLLKIAPVVQHLKQLSYIFTNKKAEIEMFCPYCNDSTRKSNPQHGHLYLSINSPVFHCFRCSTSGTLPRLLIDTGFDDEETIKYISSFIKYRYLSNSYWKKREPKKDVISEVKSQHTHVIKTWPDVYDQYQNYMISRIGDVDFSKFLSFPSVINTNTTCSFKNFEGKLITSRFIIDNYMRYQKHSEDFYFFQNMNDNFNRVVIVEGPFDTINSYLYLPNFSGSFFIGAMGMRYTSAVEYIVLRNMLIGEYEINIIFDNNIKNLKRLFWQSYKIAKMYNENIDIRAFRPLVGNDISDCPSLIGLE